MGYDGVLPEGFDVITLPAAKYLMFKGEPFADEDYCAAIEVVQADITKYDPAIISVQWNGVNPRIQLFPIGCGFDKNLIVTKQSENFPVTVNSIFAEHFL